MLDRVLMKATEGITVIEEETGSISGMLAKQLGGYASQAGRTVLSLSLEEQEKQVSTEIGVVVTPRIEKMITGEINVASQSRGRLQKLLPLESLNYDVIILDSFAAFVFEKSNKEIADFMRQLARLSKDGKSFIVAYDRRTLNDRAAAFVRSMADTVIVVRAEFISGRVDRLLYVPKMRDSKPMDKMIKITVDESGIEMDTREMVG
jgi:archaellum biogenesis ATPase FlaH